MYKNQTLVDALDTAVDFDAGIGFLEKQEVEHNLSYAHLKSEAVSMLGALQAAGVQQGDHLVVSVNENPVFIRIFWACVLGGIVPVPVGVGISAEHRNKLMRILDKLTSAWLFSYESDYARLGDAINAVLPKDRVLSPTTILESVNSPGEVKKVTAESVAFIQFSSGSTSDPKGVVLTHRNLLANIEGISEAAELTSDDISLSWMPLTHDMGLIGFHLTMLVNGIQHYLMPTELFSRRPLQWLELASKKSATLLCSPNFGYKHYLRALGEKQPDDLNLSSVRVIFNGAEPISVALINRFMSRMKTFGLSSNAMSTVYGLAEASLAVTFPKPGDSVYVTHVDRHSLGLAEPVKILAPDHQDAVGYVSEGFPVKGCLLRLCDENNDVLNDGVVGRIQISGENVTSGYYRDEENNAVSITADGWVDTGDLGFMNEHGLVVTGRNKDIIFAHGMNYYPHDLENLLVENNLAELGKVVAAGFRHDDADEDELIVFLLYRKDTAGFVQLAQQTRSIINTHTGLEVDHVLPVRRVPKTTSGKIQRRFLLNDYAAGEFNKFKKELRELERPAIADVEIADGVAGKIQSFVNEVIPEKALSPDANFFDAGISSLSLAEIHQRIEDEWPGLVDIVDLFDHQTISEVAAFIETKL